MRLRLKILLLALLPLVASLLLIAVAVRQQERELLQREHAAVQRAYMDARRDELRHYVELAVSTLQPLYERSPALAARTSDADVERDKREALRLLSALDYGEDGYFFVYDLQGRVLMHSRQPELVGRNLWGLRDAQGRPTIQQLVAQAKAVGTDYSVLIQQDEKTGDPYHMYPLQTSFGAPVFGTDDAGAYDADQLAMDSDAGRAFAAYVAKLGAEGVLNTSLSGDIAKEAFINGQAPYIITGPWNVGDFVNAGVSISIEKVPSAGGQPSQPFVGVQGFFISAKSKNALLANEFVVNYLGTKDVQLAMYEAGGRAPALQSALDEIGDDPIVGGFAEVGKDGVPMPSIPAMDTVWADWGATEVALVNQQGDCPDCSPSPVAAVILPGFHPPKRATGAVTLRGRLSYGFAIRNGIASYLRLERARVSTGFSP